MELIPKKKVMMTMKTVVVVNAMTSGEATCQFSSMPSLQPFSFFRDDEL